MTEMQVKNKYLSKLSVFAAIALSVCLASSTGAEKKPATASATSRATTKPVEPGFEKGTFDKITVHIGRLVKLNWKGENLQLDRKNWTRDFEDKTKAEALNLLEAELKQRYPNPSSKNYRAQEAERILNSPPVEGAFIRLRVAAGRLQTANAGGTINVRNNAFTTTQLKGRLEYDKAGLINVGLEERNPPNRKIVFNDEGDGTLMIALSGNRGRLSLEIKQSKDGSFYVKHVSGKNVFTGEENSFQAFHARHRRYVEGRLFPLLRHVGIITPLTPYGSAEVKKAALARLRRRPTPEKIAQGRRLIEQLNSNLYKKRQEASKLLAADFESYRDLITRMIRNPSTPAETVSRLKTIVKAKPKQKPADEFVTARGLITNIDYLIDLLGEVKPSDRAIIAKALQQLTKQKIGPDPAKWKKWRSKKQSGKSATKTGEPK